MPLFDDGLGEPAVQDQDEGEVEISFFSDADGDISDIDSDCTVSIDADSVAAGVESDFNDDSVDGGESTTAAVGCGDVDDEDVDGNGDNYVFVDTKPGIGIYCKTKTITRYREEG